MRGTSFVSTILKWAGLLAVAYIVYYVFRSYWPM
jgi:hypothetical protein